METIELDLESSDEPVVLDTDTVFNVLGEIDEPRETDYGARLSVTRIAQSVDGIHVHFQEIDTYIQKYAIENLIDEGLLEMREH